MDTSEKYVKMCEMAFELQESHSFLKAGGILGIHIDNEGNWYFGKKTAYNAMENIWLPRQDQLQEMVLSAPIKNCPAEYWDELGETIKEISNIKIFIGWEQFWLAFVMHEKYQKQWDNEREEWI